ncbi:hypothetical protein DFAR_2410006 [Desulfarculales bacterium]
MQIQGQAFESGLLHHHPVPDLFPWAEYKRAKGGVKAHTMLDHDDYMPSFVLLTEAKVTEVTLAQGLALNTGSILVLDRGYPTKDYALFGKWTGQGISFRHPPQL